MLIRALEAPTSNTWKIYIYWFFLVSITFFAVYPLCNWLTAHRNTTLDLYFSLELNIPFVPEFIWIYLSLYGLFIIPLFAFGPAQLNTLGTQLVNSTIFCGLIFVLFPTKLGFERIVPNDPFYGPLFSSLFSIDLPHNMAPSLHVVFSALILMAGSDSPRPIFARVIFIGWLVLICISTLLVHQHHLLDVVTGLLVAKLFRHITRKGESHV